MAPSSVPHLVSRKVAIIDGWIYGRSSVTDLTGNVVSSSRLFSLIIIFAVIVVVVICSGEIYCLPHPSSTQRDFLSDVVGRVPISLSLPLSFPITQISLLVGMLVL